MEKLFIEKQVIPLPNRKNIKEKIVEIDETDKNRAIAPLKMAENCLIYDNSDSPSELQDAYISAILY